MADDPILTVRQLIALLQEQPPDVPVWIEGCDCDGASVGVIQDTVFDEARVLITRADQ